MIRAGDARGAPRGGAAAAAVLAAAAAAVLAAAAAVPGAHAQNVTFSTAQEEYYFAPGERPAIPLDLSNGHGRPVSGMLSFTVAQDGGQGGVQARTINAGSQRFEVREGNNTIMIDLGAVAPPARLEVDLSFTYNDGFDPWTVEIGPIVAHVVGDPSEARNEPSPMSAQARAGAGGQQGQQAPQAQGGQGGQQQGGQGGQQGQQGQGGQQQGGQGGQQGQQAPTPPDPLDRLQNNQMAQDSGALRRQIQEQLQDEADRQNRFAEALSADPSFAEQHRRMIDDGYEVAGGSLDPSPDSEDSGEFEIQYQSPERGAASIRGAMDGGEVGEMSVASEYAEQRMLDALRADPRFAEVSAELEAAGYSQSGAQFSSDGSASEAVLEYERAAEGGGEDPGAAEGQATAAEPEPDRARVRAEFNGTDVAAVSLEYGGDEEEFDPAGAVLAAAVAGGIAAAVYLALRGQGAEPAAPPPAPAARIRRHPEPADEARHLMGEARRLHAAGDEKGAFARAGRAVRVLASAGLGIDREVTNAEAAAALAAAGRGAAGADIGACLGVADLVEFARMAPGEGDFARVSSAFDALEGAAGRRGPSS